ncbi:hypothetical protein SAMN05421767_11510 [Granulicatella balaenopterae]|uniref:Uncharacterized protein n=1 Tax=Granulicatella balaenopterae TaxID=137733 RepID=A0A1H9KQZ1_9LACT|nr:hypothetical protein [Granulicatella balaenopterae]SER01508.1 hypothetical protein SAMN05421767_11510 [Granulicatella balaenopterae]
MKQVDSNFLSRLKQLGSKDLTSNNQYPSKKTINFVTAEQKKVSIITTVSIILGIILLLGLGKVFVVDLVEEAYLAKENYQAIESNIQTLQEDSKKYAHIRDDYNRYGNGCLTDEEKLQPNRLMMIELIDRKVAVDAVVDSYDINDNHADVVIKETTLEKMAAIVERVQEDPEVTFVTVHTANHNEDSTTVDGTISITFKVGGEES